MKARKNQPRGLAQVSHFFLSDSGSAQEKVTIQMAARTLDVTKGTIITYFNKGLLKRIKEGGRIYVSLAEVRGLRDSEKKLDVSTAVAKSSESKKRVAGHKQEDKQSLSRFGQFEDETQNLPEHKVASETVAEELEPQKFEANDLNLNAETRVNGLEGAKVKFKELEKDQQERLVDLKKAKGANDYDIEEIHTRLLSVEEQLKRLSRPWWKALFGHLRLRPERFEKKGLVLFTTLTLLTVLIFSGWWFSRSPKQSPPAVTEGQAFRSEAFQATSQVVLDSELQQEQAARVVQQPSELLQTAVEPEPAALNGQTPQPYGSSVEGSPSSEQEVAPVPEADQQGVEPYSTPPPYVLRVETLATTWLQVVIDDSQELEYLLQPDENHSWRAMSGFKLHIGNAAGLQLYLNDQSLKPLGENGEVVHLQLPDPLLIVPTNSE